MQNIKDSVVADRGSSISKVKISTKNDNVEVNIKKVKYVSGIIGFILGILSSLIASYLYDLMK